MTYEDLIAHYKDEATAAFKLGYHVNSVKGWKAGIPFKTQKFIQYATAGKLKAGAKSVRKVKPVIAEAK